MSDEELMKESIEMITEVGNLILEAMKKLENALVLIGLPEREWADKLFTYLESKEREQ